MRNEAALFFLAGVCIARDPFRSIASAQSSFSRLELTLSSLASPAGLYVPVRSGWRRGTGHSNGAGRRAARRLGRVQPLLHAGLQFWLRRRKQRTGLARVQAR